MANTDWLRITAQRGIDVLRLRKETFAEIAHDPDALRQTAVIVGIAAVLPKPYEQSNEGFFYVGSVFSVIISWMMLALVYYVLGRIGLAGHKESFTYEQLLHATGFAYAPMIFLPLGFVPGLEGIVPTLTGIWYLATTTLAVQVVLKASLPRALFIVMLPIIILSIFTIILLVGLVFTLFKVTT